MLRGLSGLVRKEFYCRETKENTTVCLDSKRQKATQKNVGIHSLGYHRRNL